MKRRNSRRARIVVRAPSPPIATSPAQPTGTPEREPCQVVPIRPAPFLRHFGRTPSAPPPEMPRAPTRDEQRLAAVSEALVAAFIAGTRVRIVLREDQRRRLIAGDIERWEGEHVIVRVAHDRLTQFRIVPLQAIASVHTEPAR